MLRRKKWNRIIQTSCRTFSPAAFQLRKLVAAGRNPEHSYACIQPVQGTNSEDPPKGKLYVKPTESAGFSVHSPRYDLRNRVQSGYCQIMGAERFVGQKLAFAFSMPEASRAEQQRFLPGKILGQKHFLFCLPPKTDVCNVFHDNVLFDSVVIADFDLDLIGLQPVRSDVRAFQCSVGEFRMKNAHEISKHLFPATWTDRDLQFHAVVVESAFLRVWRVRCS